MIDYLKIIVLLNVLILTVACEKFVPASQIPPMYDAAHDVKGGTCRSIVIHQTNDTAVDRVLPDHSDIVRCDSEPGNVSGKI